MVKYLKHSEINKLKWDMCIDNAANGLIYGYSWYLDNIVGKWDALIINDYSAVMPLIWNKKFGIFYIYQPAFIQQTGLFSFDSVQASMILEFLNSIPKKFKYIHMNLNSSNAFKNSSLDTKRNYILDLSGSYDEIRKGFSNSMKKNIKKADAGKLKLTFEISADELIKLKLKTAPNKIPSSILEGMRKNIAYVIQHKQHKISGIRNDSNELTGAAFFTYSHNRWYYIFAASTEEGKNNRSAFIILNEFIKEKCQTNNILDFEGSEIPGIESFFKGFGAKVQNYYHYHENNLPFILKLFKH